ncbi:unnamed protein product [Cochlearia groenlandica]
MAQSNHETDKMLDLYIFDYLVKKKLVITAKSFTREGEVYHYPLEFDDAPGGFLYEWWYVFWSKFILKSCLNLKHPVSAAAIIEAGQGRAEEHQMRRWDPNNPSLRTPMNGIGFEAFLGESKEQQMQLQSMRQAQMQRSHPSLWGSEAMPMRSNASAFAARMYDERMKQPNPMNYETSHPVSTNHHGLDGYVLDYFVKKKLLNTAKSFMIEGKVSRDPVAIDVPGGFLFEWWSVFWDIFIARIKEKHSESAAAYIEVVASYHMAQQGKAKEHQMLIQQLQYNRQRQPQMQLRDPDHPSIRSQMNAIGFNAMLGQSNASALAAKMYEEPNPMNIETFQPHLDARMALLKLAAKRHGQMVQGNHQGGVSPAMHQFQSRAQQTPEIRSDVNLVTSPRQLSVDPSTFNSQGVLPVKENDGLNPGVSGLPLKGWPLTGIEQIGPGLGPQVQKSFMQNQSQFQPSPLQQQQQISAQVQAQGNMTDSSMYGDNDPRGCTSLPTGNMNPEDGQQNANTGSIGSAMQSSSPKTIYSSNTVLFLVSGFSFSEVGSIRNASKVTCCNFSSDGKLLASAGHDKKIFIWNMETLQTETIPERHAHTITDVCFRPNSTQLATSSLDKTIKIWDASNPGYYLRTIRDHDAAPVTSLDFHPKNTELLCSCDSNKIIRFWNVNTSSCARLQKACLWKLSTQVRFQTSVGKLLAAVSEDTLSIVHVDTTMRLHVLKDSASIHSVCWNHMGNEIASVSENSVKIWSLRSRDYIHEYSFSEGKRFESCVYHPKHHNLLVIGGYKELGLWNITENKIMIISSGHENVICAMDKSDSTGMIASASHDSCVKIWK